MSRNKRPAVRMGPLSIAAQEPSLMSEFTGAESRVTHLLLPLSSISPRVNQPRRTFTEEGLQSLAQSIRQHGIVQPLSVLDIGSSYQLIAGERRWRAAQLAGLSEVPVKVFQGLSEQQVQQLSAIENLQREDLNPVDEVDALLDIMAIRLNVPRQDLTRYLERLKSIQMRDPQFVRASAEDQDAIAEVRKIFEGLSRGSWTSFVANRLPVLRLPEELLQAVRESRLEYTKAVALRRAPEAHRAQLMKQAPELSIQQLRQAVRQARGEQETGSHQNDPAASLRPLLTPQTFAALSSKQQREARQLIKKLQTLLSSTN